jgi:hypothetical protein
MCETEYFGMSDAISIPNSIKIDGIEAVNMHFFTFLCVKVYQAHRNLHKRLLKIELLPKLPFRKINDMPVLFFGVSDTIQHCSDIDICCAEEIEKYVLYA